MHDALEVGGSGYSRYIHPGFGKLLIAYTAITTPYRSHNINIRDRHNPNVQMAERDVHKSHGRLNEAER